MNGMFRGASSFNGNISTWDVSGVVDMTDMFAGALTFDGNLSAWDVSSVTDMGGMFLDAAAFNGDLSSWDVSNVESMNGMFWRAFAFDGNLSSWDVSNVEYMRGMFFGASAFDGNLSDWDVSSVTDMDSMFNGAINFNQDLSAWDVSSVTYMNGMFTGASAFRQNLGNWHVVLDDTVISNATETLAIRAQNSWLDSRNPTYGLGTGGDSDLFVITGGTLGRNSTADYSGKTGYSVSITSTGDFGTGNHRVYDITVTGEDTIPDTAPTVTSIERSDPAAETTSAQTLVFAVTFSEDVTGVDQADFVLSSGGTGTGSVTNLAGSGSQYLVNVSAAQDGTYNLDLVPSGHGITDTADNPLSSPTPTGADHTYAVDTAAPTVASIARSDPAEATTSERTLVFAVTFSEDVTGVDLSDFALSPDSAGTGSVTNLAGSGSQYLVNVSAAQDGTYNLDLVPSGHGITDTAGNPLSSPTPTGADHTYAVDTAAPTVASIARSDQAEATTSERTLVFAVTFSEDVNGVDLSDFALSPDSAGTGSVTNLAGSGSQYLVNVSAAQDGTYNLDLVPSGHGITDTADNPLADPNPTGADHTYAVDTAAPTVASIARSDPAEATTSERTLVFAVTFSEDVTGVDLSDFALSPDSAGGGSSSGQFTQTSAPAAPITDHNTIQDAITVGPSGTATSVSVAVDITHTYIGDLVVELVAPDGTAQTLHSRSGGSANDIDRTYAPGFDGTGIVGDWTLRIRDHATHDTGTLNSWTLTIDHGGADSPVTGLTGSGGQYLVNVSAAQDGTYNLDLVSSGHGITDTADNPLSSPTPTGADHTYTVSAIPADTTAPTVASIARSNPAAETTSAQTLVFAVTFSEDVTGVDQADFVLSSGGTGTGSVTNLAGSGSQYLVNVSAAQDGTYNLDLVSSDHGITDTADNPLSSPTPTGADHTYTVSAIPADTTAPTVASIARSDPAEATTSERTLVFAVTFSEDVTGVDAGDFALSPDSTGGGSSSGQFTQTSAPAAPITDHNTIQDAVTVDQSGTATSVSVAVDISHTFIGDLVIDLIAPDGTAQTLHSRAGGSANDIGRTYAPGFDGTGIAGNWTLRVSDRAGGDTGTLNSWTLTIDHGGTGTGSVTNLAGSGSQYLVNVSAAQDGTYNLDLVSSGHGITDTADNPLSSPTPTGADHTYTVSAIPADTTAPTVASIARSNPAAETTSAQTLVFAVTFSEDVTGVDQADFVLSSGGTGTGSVTNLAGSGSQYLVNVSAAQDGTYNLDLVSSGHGITDTADNPLSSPTPTGADHTYTVSAIPADTTAPTVASIARSDPAEATTSERTLVFAVTFSEDVTGVDAGDFALSPDSTGGGSAPGRFAQTSEPATPITDRSTIQDAVTVDQSGTATSVSVAVDISHTFIGDLVIDLIAPDGTAQTLHSRAGGSANDIGRTYAPGFDGTGIAGNWTLRVSDRAGGDTGTLNSWTLTIDHGGTGTGSVTNLAGSGDAYLVNVSAARDGTYNLDLVSSGHGITDTADNPLSTPATRTGAGSPTGIRRTTGRSTYTVEDLGTLQRTGADQSTPHRPDGRVDCKERPGRGDDIRADPRLCGHVQRGRHRRGPGRLCPVLWRHRDRQRDKPGRLRQPVSSERLGRAVRYLQPRHSPKQRHHRHGWQPAGRRRPSRRSVVPCAEPSCGTRTCHNAGPDRQRAVRSDLCSRRDQRRSSGRPPDIRAGWRARGSRHGSGYRLL